MQKQKKTFKINDWEFLQQTDLLVLVKRSYSVVNAKYHSNIFKRM